MIDADFQDGTIIPGWLVPYGAVVRAKAKHMSDELVVRGVVKWFDLAKGFGFVIAEDVAQDILLHINVVRKAGRTSLNAGDLVELAYDQTPRGYQALELRSVETAEETDVPAQVAPVPASDEDIRPARLKWFDKGKGYGFLNVFGADEDVFVHIDVLRAGGLVDSQVGEALCVILTHGAKGASATAVYPWDTAVPWTRARSS